MNPIQWATWQMAFLMEKGGHRIRFGCGDGCMLAVLAIAMDSCGGFSLLFCSSRGGGEGMSCIMHGVCFS